MNTAAEAPRTGGVRMATSPSKEVSIGQLAIRFLLEGEASGGSVAVFEFDVPAAARVPIAHSHDGYEETIYGLEGVLTWTVDGEQTEIGPGVLSFDYFREMAAVIKAATYGPPDPTALAEVMRRHGLTPAP